MIPRITLRAVVVAVLAGGIVLGFDAGAQVQNSAGAQAAKRAMTFADLMAMKRVSDPQVSPSGKWVLFSVTDVSLEKNAKVNHLWVVPLDGSTAERQVTQGAGESFGRLSPDGKRISFTASGENGPDRITVAAWDEAAGTVAAARTLTGVSGDVDGAVWSPDSKRLMFTAMVWPECSVAGGVASLVHPTHNGGAGVGMDGAPGLSSPGLVGGTLEVATWKNAQPAAWADEDVCDKTRDAAVEATPVKAQEWDGLLYRHWDHWTGAKRTHVLVMDADGSHVRDLTPASEVGDAETPTWMLGGPQEYAWAPDSKEIAYVTNLDAVPAASTNNDVFTLRLDEPGARAVKVSTSLGSDDEPEYSPDGRWLAFRSQARAGFESDRFRLMVMDRGTKASRELLPKFDNWVDEFVWSPDSAHLYFASGQRGKEPVFVTDIAGKLAGQAGVIADAGEFGSIQVTPDGESLVMTNMLVDMPAMIVSTQVGVPDGRVSPLSHGNDALLHELEMSPMESFTFAGAEGTKVQGFVVRPPGFDPEKKYPVKFLMHGGPQTAWGDSWSYRWNWQLIAASGYVVIGINRRGSTGYGQKFVDEVSGDWGGRAYEDLMKGLDYAEAHYPFIDKTRECALGASYGGFMANWVLTHTDRFKCIVTHDGMFDPVSAYGTTEEMWFNEWEFRRPEDFPKGWDGFPPQRSKIAGDPGFGGGYAPVGSVAGTKTNTGVLRSAQDDDITGGSEKGRGDGHAAEPWRYAALTADEDPFRRWSPMRFIERAKTPTLVVHSQKDYRLDVSQGFELFTALQRRGVQSKMLYFPDEGHWVLKPQNSELWYSEVGDWCDRWTKTGKYAGQ